VARGNARHMVKLRVAALTRGALIFAAQVGDW
jgi:hypothetical protein